MGKYEPINVTPPAFYGSESPKQMAYALLDYQIQLQQQLEFILQNLDLGNFNPKALEELKKQIREEMQP